MHTRTLQRVKKDLVSNYTRIISGNLGCKIIFLSFYALSLINVLHHSWVLQLLVFFYFPSSSFLVGFACTPMTKEINCSFINTLWPFSFFTHTPCQFPTWDNLQSVLFCIMFKILSPKLLLTNEQKTFMWNLLKVHPISFCLSPFPLKISVVILVDSILESHSCYSRFSPFYSHSEAHLSTCIFSSDPSAYLEEKVGNRWFPHLLPQSL